MKSGQSKFFAQMTNTFPPFTPWSRKQTTFKPIQTLSIKHVLLPSKRQFVHSYPWLAISYSLAHFGPFSLHHNSKVHLTLTVLLSAQGEVIF
jgi:hypothetical protein